MNRLVPAAAVLLLAAAAPAADKPADARADFFRAGKVVRLDFKLDPKDLDSLRRDARKYVKATLTEDGRVTYADVAVRLRGTAGSFRGVDDKPGLTINVDKFADGQRFHGMDKFHLNNSVQDPTYLQELVCGELFRAAGVPAARVGHAVVTLNGRKLGLYYLKEGYDKGFLKEHFGDPSGNLYDGGFLRDIDQPLELSSGGKAGAKDHADLKAVVAVAREPDHARRLRKLDQLVELDQFLALMALEVIAWDWDGYPMKPNNYRVYVNPRTSKLSVIPSGMDQMFGDVGGAITPGFGGLIARKLMETDEGRRRYLQKLAEVNQKVFKPDDILKRLDELQARVQPALAGVDAGAGKDYPNQVNRLRQAIPARAKSVTEQLKKAAK